MVGIVDVQSFRNKVLEQIENLRLFYAGNSKNVDVSDSPSEDQLAVISQTLLRIEKLLQSKDGA